MVRIPVPSAPRHSEPDERGIALLVVIALMAIVGALMVTLVTVAIYESRASGRDRQRSSAVMTAEGQVDSVISEIQAAPPASLPCGVLTTPAVGVSSDVMSITTTVNYFTATDVPVDCSDLPTIEVAKATIKSTSTSNALAGQAPAVRTVETLLHLTPTYANSLDKAIFGNAGVTLANKADIYGENGQPNADVYTNGNVVCNNNQSYYGSIYAQGTVSMSNTCTVAVDVEAKQGFSGTNPGVSVNGKILVSNGNISLTKASVGQQARASGTVTGDICSTAGKCFSGDASIAPPAAEPFPQYVWDSTTQAAWVAQGYTVVTFPQAGYPCGMVSDPGPYNGSVDYVAKWVYEHMTTMGKTVIYANCPTQPFKVQQNHSTIALNSDLAIFDTGGFNFSNNTTITSSSSTLHLLYLIQPYDSVTTHPCTADGISLDNQVTITDTINELLYSPCSIRKANLSTTYGQIYGGGNVTIDNQLTMYYTPLPVFGLSVTGSPVDSYAADILYKRETNQ